MEETLKELNHEYKERKLRNAQPEDKDLSRYIGRLVKDNPFLAALLKIGEEVPTEKPEGPKKEYIGEYIPTMFELREKEKETSSSSASSSSSSASNSTTSNR